MNADYVTPAGYTPYAAVSGTVEVTDLLTPHQSKGRIFNVRYDEVTLEADSSAKPVLDGKCLWLKEATWNTERPLGCAPFTRNTCGDGKFCMPTNAIGDDGICATTGTKVVDEVCTPGNTGLWDSDCGPGLRCAKFTVDVGRDRVHLPSALRRALRQPRLPGHRPLRLQRVPVHRLPPRLPAERRRDRHRRSRRARLRAQPEGHLLRRRRAPRHLCVTDMGSATAVCRPLLHSVSERAADQLGGCLADKADNDSSSIFGVK